MKIGFLTSANSWHIPVRTKYLISKGYTVYCFELYPGGESPIRQKGVNYLKIKSQHKNRLLRNISRILQVRKLSKKFRIDIFHIMGLGYAFYSIFSKVKKIVIENNGSDVLVIPEKNLFTKIFYKIFYKLLYLFSDAVVQDSKVAQEAGVKYGAPVTNNKVIELGIDFNIFNMNVIQGKARKRLKLKSDQKMVFSPRSFTENSNIETIIKTIPLVKRKFPNVKYIFCRHFGNLESNYQRLIDRFKISENVFFTGFLDNELDMPFYSRDSDVILSVLTSDSSPRSVYESMACGKPVIISELPWYHGKFEKGKDILTVPVKDEFKLSDTILKVLQNEISVDLKSAHDKVKNDIDMIDHSRKMEDLYKKILSEN